MGIRNITSHRFDCDRCDDSQHFDDVNDAKRAGWLTVRVDGRQPMVLCPNDMRKHGLFLMGDKTGAGCRFNVGESERLASVK